MHQAALIGEGAQDASDYGWTDEGARERRATRSVGSRASPCSCSARRHDWLKMTQSIQMYIRSLNFKYRTELRSKGVLYENAFGQFVGPHRLKVRQRANDDRDTTRPL
jgi:thioredoxin reductase (NADPH)